MVIDDSIANLFRHFRNYLVGDVVARAIIFLMFPLLTFILTPGNFGIVAVFNSMTVLMVPLLSLNTYTAVGRHYFEKTGNFSAVVSTTLALSTTLFVVMSLVILIKIDEVAELMKLPEETLLLLLPLVILIIIRSIYSQICRSQEKSRELVTLNCYSSIVYVGLTLVFIFGIWGDTYRSVILANLAVHLFIAVFVIYRIRELLRLSNVDFTHLKYALAYGVPLIPYTLSSEILASFDVLMINSYLGSDQAGIYSFAYRLGSVLLIIIMAINSAWTPKYMRYMYAGDYDKHDQFSRHLLKTVLAISCILICFGDYGAVLISDEAFTSGAEVIPLIVLGYAFYMVFVIYNKHTTFVKRMVFQSLVTVAGGILNIGLNMWLIPVYGFTAAAYTTVVSFAFMAVFSCMINHYVIRIYTIPFSAVSLYLAPVIFLAIVKQGLYMAEIPLLFQLPIVTTCFAAVMFMFLGRYFNYYSVRVYG